MKNDAPLAAAAAVRAGAPLQLSIVVPTFNEAGNIVELRDRVAAALPGIEWELIFVDDDSPDGTAAKLHALAQQDRRVRCLLRIGRRGLASACIEGMLAASAPVVAVIDADLQHDETRLPTMLELLRDPAVDVVVGSRYAQDGSVAGWDEARASISRIATRLARLVLKAELRDPMSGFFMMRREVLLRCVRAGVSGVGFKILLDLFATSPTPLRFREVPYTFRQRFSGESKLDTNVAWEYFIMLLDRFFGRAVPIRFIAFSLVGGLGLGVHLLVLSVLFRGGGVSFLVAQASATLVAMTGNFVLNNLLTYRDMRLRGWQMLRGWVSFTIACSVGAFANVGIAAYLFDRNTFWIASAIVGVLVGAVWNYAVTAVYTWKGKAAPPPVPAERRPADCPAAKPRRALQPARFSSIEDDAMTGKLLHKGLLQAGLAVDRAIGGRDAEVAQSRRVHDLPDPPESGSGHDFPLAADGLANAAAAALAASSHRTVAVEHAGTRYVLKRAATGRRRLGQSLALCWLVKRVVGSALPMRTLRLPQASAGLGFEARRLDALRAAGVRVPHIAHRGDGYLLLEHGGTTFATLLKGWSVGVWRKELPRLAQELAGFHRAGHWHGAAQIKNLTRRDGLHYRIDFEEDFGEFVPLAAAQALDLVLFLNSISLRGPIDEVEARRLLPELLDTYFAANPDPLVVQAIAQALPWLAGPIRTAARCMCLRVWGRRRNGVARLVILTDVLAQLLRRSPAFEAQRPQPSPY